MIPGGRGGRIYQGGVPGNRGGNHNSGPRTTAELIRRHHTSQLALEELHRRLLTEAAAQAYPDLLNTVVKLDPEVAAQQGLTLRLEVVDE